MIPSPSETKDVWACILDLIKAKTKPQQFDTWFRSLRCLTLDASRVVVGAPNDFYKKWMEDHYVELLREACREVLFAEPVIEFTTVKDAEVATVGAPALAGAAVASGVALAPPTHAGGSHGGHGDAPPPPPPPPTRSPATPRVSGDIRLNPHYTFENFVVGPSNRLGHAAALAVAESPATVYNPLFLHGGVGLGKTHLLQAICHSILLKSPQAEVCYLSCEAFVNEYIQAIQKNETESFRARYRRVDMLLVDDIHFLGSKKALQEEFFHTFNALYNAQRQVILSSDSPPHEIPDLEARLVSRFKWGLVAEMEPPQLETKIAIIQRKAALRGKEIPDNVVHYLANHLDTNIRELEGAVQKLIAYAGMLNQPIDISLCKHALKDLTDKPGQVAITDIMTSIATHFHLRIQDLQGKARHQAVARARQIAMYIARKLTPLSLEEIGGHFGGRDHTTVLYAEQRIREMTKDNPQFAELIEKLCRELTRDRGTRA